MKVLVVLILTFFSFFACAESKVEKDICQQTWKESDQEEFQVKYLSETCRLETEDGKYALQMVLYKKKCRRFEDAPERDCFFVRECGGDFTTRRMSPSVYDKETFIESLCNNTNKKNEDYPLLSSDTFSERGDFSQAFISCKPENKKNLAITLKVNQKTKSCKFPFKR